MPDSADLIQRAAADLVASRYAVALTGAGVSTESGIPDFRGPSGVWTKNPEAERRAYLGYERFLQDPKAWWQDRLASPGVLGNLGGVKPNASHYALAELESLGILKWTITQNVDGLHGKAGTKNLLEYHGNAFKLRCTGCGSRFEREEYDLSPENLPPHCRGCGGIVKTDGVSFGEPIPEDVAGQSYSEAGKCDLMLICGTSAVVYPFAQLPRIARASGGAVKIIEVNAEPTPLTAEHISDYIIQGKTGEVLPGIVAAVKKLKRP